MEVRTAIDGPCCNPTYWSTVSRREEWDNARELYNLKCGVCKEVYPSTRPPVKVQQFDAEHPFA